MTIINEGYKEYKLENGLIVALQKTPTQTISTKLRINQGAYHELPEERGMAHFLEHCLVTCGSKKYDPIQADNIRNSFGYSNAFTSIGRTFFIGKMLSEDIDTWLNYTSDHIFNPRFDIQRMEGERGRILREMSEKKSDPSYEAQREFCRVFYRGHPKHLDILGSEEIVRNANLEKLASFHQKGFSPNNMELILVGGLPENIQDLIETNFGKYPQGKDTRLEFPKLTPLTEQKRIHFSVQENAAESTAEISLCYVGPDSKNIDCYSLCAMNNILEELLFQELGLRQKLAYSTGATYKGDYNAGEGYVYAKVPASEIERSIESIFGILREIKNKKISEKEINILKKVIRYNQAKTFESDDGYIYAIESRLDKEITPEMVSQAWNQVSADSINMVANRYLPSKEGNYILYIKDPLKDKIFGTDPEYFI